MARPIYSHEIVDPDFQWLINNYTETHPNVILVDHSGVPVVLILTDAAAQAARVLDELDPLTFTGASDPHGHSNPEDKKQ